VARLPDCRRRCDQRAAILVRSPHALKYRARIRRRVINPTSSTFLNSHSAKRIDLPGCRNFASPMRSNDRMNARGEPNKVRTTIFLIVLFFHAGVIVAFLRERIVYRSLASPSEGPLTIFFINPQAAPSQRPPEATRYPRQSSRVRKPPVSEGTGPNLQAEVSQENPGAASGLTIDWAAEAQRSAAEIANRGDLRPLTELSALPTTPAPWNPHPELLEFTGHGLKVRIPVKIPGKVIDHCFANFDLKRDEEWGTRELYQLECALTKQPARGDLFDSLRKPPEPQK
jgi:hypothetical protein